MTAAILYTLGSIAAALVAAFVLFLVAWGVLSVVVSIFLPVPRG